MSISLPQIGNHREYLRQKPDLAGSPASSSWLGALHVCCVFLSRLGFGSFFLLTSVYCLLVWVPFSYFGFIHHPLVSWLPIFVRLHGLLYGILLILVAGTLIPDLRRGETRRAVIGFLVLNSCAAVYLGVTGGLGSVEPDLKSYIWSMLSLFPLVWLAALDFAACADRVFREMRHHLNLAKTTVAALAISMAFAISSVFRGARDNAAALRGFPASLCFHLAIFTAVGLVLILIRWVSSRGRHPELLHRLLTSMFVGALLVQILRKMILPTISFEGVPANVFAVIVSLIVVLFTVASGARVRAARGNIVPVSPSKWLWCFGVLLLIAAAYGIPALLARTDWDFVLQRSAVILLWLLALQIIRTSGIESTGRAVSIALLVVLACAFLGFARYAKLTLYNPNPAPEWQGALDDYAGTDISFKTAYDILSRPVDNKAYREFYQFLKQNTNLSRNDHATPGDVRLVANLQPASGTKPNIFVFVIDSLRKDMLSPYDPAADYTPAIDRFARESVVFKNAYTRYGGTALSEPAIWVGAMQLHKQYIEPFYPMNNLQKLLDMDGYRSYISVDPILRMMLARSASITELDTDNKSWSDLDFVPTLKELQAKIDARADRDKPIFAYTQPQNVHTLTLERSKIKGGRKAVSIYELHRMDAALGEFVQFLRQRGLYDNSIIVLTADHGDSYGEFGRWGHSDFLFPEVIRIPLIVHLPLRMREQFVSDADQLAFTTDITPSLYYLLGHRPIINNELFGRPLFTQTPQEQSAYMRSHYLIVSSYASVYAVLSGSGQSLFIADAVNSRSYYYDLKDDPAGTHNHVSIQQENENQALIRHDVNLIANFYGWHSSHAQ